MNDEGKLVGKELCISSGQTSEASRGNREYGSAEKWKQQPHVSNSSDNNKENVNGKRKGGEFSIVDKNEEDLLLDHLKKQKMLNTDPITQTAGTAWQPYQSPWKSCLGTVGGLGTPEQLELHASFWCNKFMTSSSFGRQN